MTPEQAERFDAILNALRDYRLYREGGGVTETENLPPSIHGAIVHQELEEGGDKGEGEEGEEREEGEDRGDRGDRGDKEDN